MVLHLNKKISLTYYLLCLSSCCFLSSWFLVYSLSPVLSSPDFNKLIFNNPITSWVLKLNIPLSLFVKEFVSALFRPLKQSYPLTCLMEHNTPSHQKQPLIPQFLQCCVCRQIFYYLLTQQSFISFYLSNSCHQIQLQPITPMLPNI